MELQQVKNSPLKNIDMPQGFGDILKEGGSVNLTNLRNYGQIDFAIKDWHKQRSGIGSIALSATKATIDSGASQALGTIVASVPNVVGFLNYVTKIKIFSTIKVQLRIGQTAATVNFPNYNEYVTVPANTLVTFDVYKIFRFNDQFQVGVKKWLDSDITSNIDLTISFEDSGVYPDEFIQNATIEACIIGDSINAGSSGTKTENMYNYMLRNELRKRGVSISIPYNKSVSGKDSDAFLSYARNGYIVPGCRAYFIAVGANDSAIANRTKAAYKANINELVDLYLSAEGSPMVILEAPTLNENNTYEALNIQYRAAISEIVTERNNSRVFGIDLGTNSFDRTVTSNYMATDTAGSRIHPSDIGNAAIFNNCIVPYLNSAAGLNFIAKLKTFK